MRLGLPLQVVRHQAREQAVRHEADEDADGDGEDGVALAAVADGLVDYVVLLGSLLRRSVLQFEHALVDLAHVDERETLVEEYFRTEERER